MEQVTVTKNMVIQQVFDSNPGKSQKLAQIMSNAGINCVGCSASTDETIEQGMISHGLSLQEVEVVVTNLNKAITDKTTSNETETKEGVTVSNFAAVKVKGFRKAPGDMFKITLNEGSCGFTYGFKFKNKRDDDEVEYESNGVKILINKSDVPKLKGMELDFVDGMQGAGFKILNPNVKGSCGCGSSVHI